MFLCKFLAEFWICWTLNASNNMKIFVIEIKQVLQYSESFFFAVFLIWVRQDFYDPVKVISINADLWFVFYFRQQTAFCLWCSVTQGGLFTSRTPLCPSCTSHRWPLIMFYWIWVGLPWLSEVKMISHHYWERSMYTALWSGHDLHCWLFDIKWLP